MEIASFEGLWYLPKGTSNISHPQPPRSLIQSLSQYLWSGYHVPGDGDMAVNRRGILPALSGLSHFMREEAEHRIWRFVKVLIISAMKLHMLYLKTVYWLHVFILGELHELFRSFKLSSCTSPWMIRDLSIVHFFHKLYIFLSFENMLCVQDHKDFSFGLGHFGVKLLLKKYYASLCYTQ